MAKDRDLNAIKARRIDSRPFSEISDFKVKRKSKKKKRINRSLGGDIAFVNQVIGVFINPHLIRKAFAYP